MRWLRCRHTRLTARTRESEWIVVLGTLLQGYAKLPAPCETGTGDADDTNSGRPALNCSAEALAVVRALLSAIVRASDIGMPSAAARGELLGAAAMLFLWSCSSTESLSGAARHCCAGVYWLCAGHRRRKCRCS